MMGLFRFSSNDAPGAIAVVVATYRAELGEKFAGKFGAE
jgi:hypothetical protein